MKHKIQFTATLICMLVVLKTSSGGVTYSRQCVYKGYQPGLVNEVRKNEYVQPAKFQDNILQQALSYFNTGSGVTAATLGMIDAVGDVMKMAPQLSAALGIVTVGLGFLNESPSPNDVLDKALEAVTVLSEEVDLQMDQMKDYVDSKVLTLEKVIMKNNYKELFDKWVNCAKESTTQKTLDCQHRAVSSISSARYHFQPLNDLFEKTTHDYKGREKLLYDPHFDYRASAATFQWMEKECGSRMECLSHDQVKRLEIGSLVFRDYATLHLLALQTLAASYKAEIRKGNKAVCHSYKTDLQDMAEKGDNYVRYVKWAYEWTYIRQYEENDYFGVKDRVTGRRDTARVGGFMGTKKCSGGKCEMQCAQMFNDNTCSATGADDSTLGDNLNQKCETYVGEVKKQLMKFWNDNVLNLAKTWEKYRDDAKEKLKHLDC